MVRLEDGGGVYVADSTVQTVQQTQQNTKPAYTNGLPYDQDNTNFGVTTYKPKSEAELNNGQLEVQQKKDFDLLLNNPESEYGKKVLNNRENTPAEIKKAEEYQGVMTGRIPLSNADLLAQVKPENKINLAGTSQNDDAYLINNPYTHTESIVNRYGKIYTAWTDVSGKSFGLIDSGLPAGTTVGGIQQPVSTQQNDRSELDLMLYGRALNPGDILAGGVKVSHPLSGDTPVSAGVVSNGTMMLNNVQYSDPLNAIGIFNAGKKVTELGNIPKDIATIASSFIPGGSIALAANEPVFKIQQSTAAIPGTLIQGIGAGLGLAEATIQDIGKGNVDTLSKGFSGGILGNPVTTEKTYTVNGYQHTDKITVDMPNLGEQLVIGAAPSLFAHDKGYLQVKENLSPVDVVSGTFELGLNAGLLYAGARAGGIRTGDMPIGFGVQKLEPLAEVGKPVIEMDFSKVAAQKINPFYDMPANMQLGFRSAARDLAAEENLRYNMMSDKPIYDPLAITDVDRISMRAAMRDSKLQWGNPIELNTAGPEPLDVLTGMYKPPKIEPLYELPKTVFREPEYSTIPNLASVGISSSIYSSVSVTGSTTRTIDRQDGVNSILPINIEVPATRYSMSDKYIFEPIVTPIPETVFSSGGYYGGGSGVGRRGSSVIPSIPSMPSLPGAWDRPKSKQKTRGMAWRSIINNPVVPSWTPDFAGMKRKSKSSSKKSSKPGMPKMSMPKFKGW